MSSRKGWHLIFCMREMICSFFGHRDIPITDRLFDLSVAEITRAVKDGYRTFYFGGYGDFDTLCYQIVTKIKNENPALQIQRIFCVPQERYLRKDGRFFKRENYDEIIYLLPSFDGWYKSIYFRNCAMIDKSDLIIFYVEDRIDSGAYKAFQYAKRKNEKKIVNLWGN